MSVVQLASASVLRTVDRQSGATALDEARKNVTMIHSTAEAEAWREKAEALRAAFKQMKDAEAQRIAATKLEMALVRRIGQLGGEDIFGVQKRAMARGLARLTDDEFLECLSGVAHGGAPITIWHQYKENTPEMVAQREKWRRQAEEEQQRFWSRYKDGGEFASKYDATEAAKDAESAELERVESVASVACKVLETLDLGDKPFTTAEVANEVVESMTRWGSFEELDWAQDERVSEMLHEAVRGSMRATYATADYLKDAPYARITFTDPDKGWIHMPWHLATVAQLAAFADYAQSQADSMQARADKIAAEVIRYEQAIPEGESRSTRMVDLKLPREQKSEQR